MKNLVWLSACILIIFASCSESQRSFDRRLTDAERLLAVDCDSALALIADIEPGNLHHDSLKAKLHYVRGYAHLRQNRSLLQDSLVGMAHIYYSGKDTFRDIQSGVLLASYKYWVGDPRGAIAFLDSIISLPNVPDSLMVKPLRIRTFFGAAEYQGEGNIPYAKRLILLEKDTMRKIEAKYMLISAYECSNQCDSALMLVDELIDYAKAHKWGDKQFQFELERAQLLTELGREQESQQVIADIFRKSSADNGAADYLHLQNAVNNLNSGNIPVAKRELQLADSFALKLRGQNDGYYRSYSNLLNAMIDFKQTGRMRLAHVSALNNRQQERFNRMEASQWESERSALRLQARSMELRAESERKTMVILVLVFIALTVAAGAVIIMRNRRRKEIEIEERAEALELMVEELKSTPVVKSSSEKETLRRAMMQHLGIIRMVAETPTESNRDMLRRISSIENDSADTSLVNWSSLFDAVDTLYDNFHHKLHQQLGAVLSDKEEQIIVLMVAGFSTKEIGVITSQSAATIYVRKSSIRKKLGIPQKEDIVAYVGDWLKR